MNRMRDNLVFVTAAKSPWGAEHSLSLLCQGLAKNYPLRVICQSEETASFLRQHGVEHVQVIRRTNNRVLSVFAFLSAIRRSPKPSKVIIFSLQLAPISVLLRMISPRQIQTILDVHDVPQGIFDRFAARISAHFSHRTLSISQYVSDSMGLRSRTFIVPRPIEVPPAPAKAASPNTKLFVVSIVGRIDPEKRIETAIRAIAQCEETTVLRVYGEPVFAKDDYLREIQALADKLAPNRVEFAGRQQPIDIYSRSDAVIICNANEPSGRTAGEAMAHGVPIIVPDQGGSPEYLPEELSWLKYRSLDASSAATVISQLSKLTSAEMQSIQILARNYVSSTRASAVATMKYAEALDLPLANFRD